MPKRLSPEQWWHGLLTGENPMTLSDSDIARLRLRNQGLSQIIFREAVEAVTQLGAVQAQDYSGAKWAIGQRIQNATDAAIDQAFNEGKILRTHVMRPTWHFVAPADIRWLLELTGPRVHAVNAFMYRKLELERHIIKKSYAVLEKVLKGNQQWTRTELASAFQRAGIIAEGQRLAYLIMSAELDGVICSGPRSGKQFTYALLEERVPQVKALTRDEALVELMKRYFATRGPATSQDFTWWSGLTMADAKKGIEMVKAQLVSERINGQVYWFSEAEPPASEKSPAAYLLPNYDEYFIGFKDRSAIGMRIRQPEANHPALNAHIAFIDGQAVGGWRRTLTKNEVIVELELLTDVTKAEKRALAEEANRYGDFLGLPVEYVEAN